MLVSINGENNQLDQFIESNYEFRNNLMNKVLGKESIEYKRVDLTSWNPFSCFASQERRHIIKSHNISREEGRELYPSWLIQKAAQSRKVVAPDFIENPDYLKLLNELPVKVSGVRPIKTTEREPVILKRGDRCYISFGMKKKWFKKYYSTLPAVIDSITHVGQEEYYNIFILKTNKKGIVEYFGRHMVLTTEIGSTPKEAAQNVAYSQAIY